MKKQDLINILAEGLEVSPEKAKVLYDVIDEMIENKLMHALPGVEERIEDAVKKRLSDTLAKF